MLLQAARKQYEDQQELAAAGLAQARRVAPRGAGQVARVVGRYQASAALVTLEFAPEVLSEQGLSTAALGTVDPSAVVTGSGLASLLDQAQTDAAFDAIVLGFIADAGRTAQNIDMAARPAATGYVRSLTPPSCSRCAILAGRVYRYSQGFLRHPRCDCLMTPTSQAVGLDLVTDPDEMFRLGQIRGLSKADTQAVMDGADLNQVVNIRRSRAGLTVAGSVLSRADRPTPAGIYAAAGSKEEAFDLFRKYGYFL